MRRTKRLKPLEPAEQIAEYYESIKHLHPNLSLAQVETICRSSSKLLKRELEKGSLKTVRLKYLGQFSVQKGRAKGMLRKTEIMFRREKVSLDIRNYIQGIVKEYFKREYNEDLPLDEIDKI